MPATLSAPPLTTRFILMPARGTRAPARTLEADLLMSFSLGRELSFGFRGQAAVRVIDQIREDGPRLMEIPTRDMMAFRAQHPHLRVVPLRHFRPQLAHLALARNLHRARAVSQKPCTVRVTAAGGAPVVGCKVLAFTSVATRSGFEAITDAAGDARLMLPSHVRLLEALAVRPAHGYWSQLVRDVRLNGQRAGQIGFRLDELVPGTDALSHFYSSTPAEAGLGLRVAVVDTGVGPHPDLTVAGGANTVVGEDETQWGDNGLGHGTHVAGIVCAHHGSVVRSLAPAAELWSYRVFGQNAETATNYAIAKAIDRAVAAGCHLINLSLGGPQADAATRDAITDALDAGSVVVAANGNDGRKAVSFPANVPGVAAVSAFGRRETYPANSSHAWHEDHPAGSPDPLNYLARFTNIGPETQFTAPGVGILSCVPGGHAALDGTSMAAPAVTGRLAALWSADAGLMQMGPDHTRTAAVLNTAAAAGRCLGFGAHFEGDGQL